MKRFVFAYFTLAVLGLSGCGLTQAEIDQAVSKSAAIVSDNAGKIAADIVYKQALKDGKSIEEAQAMAAKAKDVADAASKSLAETAAANAAKTAADDKGTKTASAWGGGIMAVLGIIGAVLGKVL